MKCMMAAPVFDCGYHTMYGMQIGKISFVLISLKSYVILTL